MQGLCVHGKEGDEWGAWEALSKRPMRSCWNGSPVSRRIETSRGCGEADFSCIWVVGLLHPEADMAGCCQGNCFLCGAGRTLTLSAAAAVGAASTQCLWRRRDFDTSGRAHVYCQDWTATLLCSGWRQSILESVFCVQESVSHRVSDPAEKRGTLSLSPAPWWPMEIKGDSAWATCLTPSFSVATL